MWNLLENSFSMQCVKENQAIYNLHILYVLQKASSFALVCPSWTQWVVCILFFTVRIVQSFSHLHWGFRESWHTEKWLWLSNVLFILVLSPLVYPTSFLLSSLSPWGKLGNCPRWCMNSPLMSLFMVDFWTIVYCVGVLTWMIKRLYMFRDSFRCRLFCELKWGLL